MYNLEELIQKSVANYIRNKFKDVLFTIAPAGVRRGSKIQRIIAGKQAKEMGYRAGCPDLLIFKAKHGFHGLFIELKTETGKPDKSGNQIRFRDQAIAEGYKSVICYGEAQAIQTIDQYLK